MPETRLATSTFLRRPEARGVSVRSAQAGGVVCRKSESVSTRITCSVEPRLNRAQTPSQEVRPRSRSTRRPHRWAELLRCAHHVTAGSLCFGSRLRADLFGARNEEHGLGGIGTRQGLAQGRNLATASVALLYAATVRRKEPERARAVTKRRVSHR